jgi:acetolactate synthase-1/2/3 large subunit
VSPRNGASRIVQALSDAGVRCVFGIPGTQTVELFEALRQSDIRTVLTTSELAASFMAGAWARVAGEPGILITMGGPGFTLALTGIAEARLDSVPLLHIAGGVPVSPSGRRFLQQEIAQSAIAAPLVKAIITIGEQTDPYRAVLEALRVARSGEPGPVLLHVSQKLLGAHPPLDVSKPPLPETEELSGIAAVRARVVGARRPVFLVGGGVDRHAQLLRTVVERLGAPVLTTPSARGTLPDDHPLHFGFDPVMDSIVDTNAFLESADLILVLGAKLGHNGTGGFKLRLPEDRTVHVDTASDVIGANYPVSLGVVADAGSVLGQLLDLAPSPRSWTTSELRDWRARTKRRPDDGSEPCVGGSSSRKPRDFFAALRRALPPEGILVLDSGVHQILARRYFTVLSSGGLIFPSDLQSMGFGIPSAIGARLAAPSRPVVALVGDGGFAMTGLELLSVAREHLSLTVIVFVDGALGQIRMQQLASYGASYAVDLMNPDFELLALAIGGRYEMVGNDAEAVIRSALGSQGVTLIEVSVGDTMSIRRVTATARVRETARKTGVLRLVKRFIRFFWR